MKDARCGWSALLLLVLMTATVFSTQSTTNASPLLQESTPVPAGAGDRLALLDLDTLTHDNLSQAWQGRSVSTGRVALELDGSRALEGESQSLHAVSIVPCGDGRWAQIDHPFAEVQDLSAYRTLSIWVRAEPGISGELSVLLVEPGPEDWQSTRWYEGSGEWQRLDFSLTQGEPAQADPWEHPYDFVVPSWFDLGETQSPSLDLTQIQGIRLKALSVESNCAAQPRTDVWIGALWVSTEEFIPPPPPPLVVLPVIETFDYADDLHLSTAWRAVASDDARIHLTVENTPGAVPNPPAMAINAWVPCASPRYMMVMRRFEQPLDLSGYEYLSIAARGDGQSAAPYGGEFSVTLWDGAGEADEAWQSTRWLDRAGGVLVFTIRLAGDLQDREPWHHPDDFTVPSWEALRNGQLDLGHIVGIALKATNTDDSCGAYPGSWVMVDDIVVGP